MDYVIGTIPADLMEKGPLLTVVYQVLGETVLRTVKVDDYIID